MIVDAHNDLLLELVLSREEGKFGDLILRTGDERLFDRYWLPKLEVGGVGIQVCPLHTADKPYARTYATAAVRATKFLQIEWAGQGSNLRPWD